MEVVDTDLVVVGLGAMGAAVALHAAAAGLAVVGIDRYDPPHGLGSSKAETRITRLAVGEGPQYLPFVRRSHELWRDLEVRTSTSLLHECGGLIVTEPQPVPGQRWEDFATETARIAARAQIPYELLKPAVVRDRHPVFKVPDGLVVGHEPTGGLVMVDAAIRSQLELATRAGAHLRRNEQVLHIESNVSGVRVRTEAGEYRAANVVCAVGAWTPSLAPRPVADQLRVTRQVVFWFEAADPGLFRSERLPFVMWVGERDEDYVGLFPTPPGAATDAVKVLGEQFLETTSPELVERDVAQSEIDEFFDRHVEPKFDGITRSCVRAEVCLYTNTPDDHFLIDRDPRSDRIVIMSACSGHGFKHSAALGQAVAQRIASGGAGGFGAGSSDLDLDPFRLR